MPPKKDYFQWWKERIEAVKGFKNEANKFGLVTKRTYDVHAWGILKLSLLAFYVAVYSRIIKAHFPQAYYLDLFAGPGLNRIKETGDLILGSPLLADLIPKAAKKFDKLLLIERDQNDANALRKLLPKADVFHNDVNADGLDLALKVAQRGSASVPMLAFVDPEGLAVHWATLDKLLRTWSDVIINYQPLAVRRTIGSIKTNLAYKNALNLYFGSDVWKDCENDGQLFQSYLINIQQHKEVVIPIRVNGVGGFYYYIIFAVKRTKGAQEWIGAIERAREKIEQATSADAQRFLDIYKGKQLTFGLSSYT